MRQAAFLIIAACLGTLFLNAQDGAASLPIDLDGRNEMLTDLPALSSLVSEANGRWTVSTRYSGTGAAGLQLFVENLRLRQGDTLSFFEVDASGDRGRQVTVYEGVGPLQGDAFWSAPVPGDQAIVEVSFAADDSQAPLPGTLPFQVTTLRKLTATGLARLLADQQTLRPLWPELEGTKGLARFRGAVVPYVIQNGLAVFEGDVVLGPAEQLQKVSDKELGSQRQSLGITGSYYRWPAGVVPYEIDPTLPNTYRITDAIAHWNSKLPGTITLRPRNGEAEFVRFVNTTSSGTCSSYIGNVHMAGQAITVGSSCSTGNVIHEIGHAVGLFHEHTREDRDTFVRINFANINTSMTQNFNQSISSSDDLGSYDYGSIMHYPATAFSINGLPTIETIPAGISIGQRSGLSAGDLGGVRIMYPATSLTSVSVTIGSNPAGQTLLVDNVSLTGPVTLQWAPGSSHTISAPGSNSGTTRFVFRNWSDGGAQTHTITVPTSSWTVTANFQKQHRFVSASADTTLGTVANSPLSSDLFYNEGTSVTVSAKPTSATCLSGWTGVTAPPSTPILVTVNQPYSVTGNFKPGLISAAPALFTIAAAGGNGTIVVSNSGGCPWTATSNVSWLTITAGTSGTTSGQVNFTVARKKNKAARTATITIGTSKVVVNQ